MRFGGVTLLYQYPSTGNSDIILGLFLLSLFEDFLFRLSQIGSLDTSGSISVILLVMRPPGAPGSVTPNYSQIFSSLMLIRCHETQKVVKAHIKTFLKSLRCSAKFGIQVIHYNITRVELKGLF